MQQEEFIMVGVFIGILGVIIAIAAEEIKLSRDGKKYSKMHLDDYRRMMNGEKPRNEWER